MTFLRNRFSSKTLSVVGATTGAAVVTALLGLAPASAPLSAPAPVDGTAVGSDVSPAAATRWTGTWGMAPYLSFKTVTDKTLRMVVHNSVAGNQVRIHLSNRFGGEPVAIGGATIGLQSTGAGIEAGTLRQLTFSGLAQTVIPENSDIISDPVALDVPALGAISVSLYLPAASSGAEHSLGDGFAFTSTTGNHSSEVSAASFGAVRDNYMFLSGVDVSVERGRTIVAFGDSITDGGTTVDGRYPSVLAWRLQGKPRFDRFGVVNTGIGASELLETAALFGLSGPGITRMDHDVLLQPNVETVVIMMGTNDILGGHAATGEEVIAGLKQFTTKAHDQGIRVMAGTITPCECYDDTKNAEREEVNAWIRTTDMLDATVDFDKALRDPANPRRMLPAYDSGDGLHPGDKGYQAMAMAINLRDLTGVS